jgi:hypothetical protein
MAEVTAGGGAERHLSGVEGEDLRVAWAEVSGR